MRVQIISYENYKYEIGEYVFSLLNSPRSLDEFDINIIDLSSEELWENRGNSYSTISAANDIVSICRLVQNKEKAAVVYVLPQNVTFHYNWGPTTNRQRGPRNHIKLKDMLNSFCNDILSKAFPIFINPNWIAFEKTTTRIKGKDYEADFAFLYDFCGCKTKSHISEKVTTVKAQKDGLYISTLNITNDKERLIAFINYLFLDSKQEEEPKWFSQIKCFDDEMNEELISIKEKAIEEAKQEIECAKAKLATNAHYKSIIYTNSDELVSVVFEILQKLLDCDLTKFDDVNEEDFLIRKESCTFIGEIKGVTSNVKNEYISQLENHYHRYCDRMQDIPEPSVKQLLIINPLRLKHPNEREEINEQQIKLAERNGCLIIETATLLKLYERFIENEISSDECIKMLADQVGLLQI